jgi:hypothetical protein
VWKQLRQGREIARSEAVDIIGDDPGEAGALREYFEGLPPIEARSLSGGHFRARILGALSKHESVDWLLPYLKDKAEQVRDKAVELLIDEPQAQAALRQCVFADLGPGSGARARVWKKFASDPEVREELKLRAREDQWEVRRAYFALSSDEESRTADLRAYMATAIQDASRTDVLPELLQALARDDEALPQLRPLITSPNSQVVTTLMHVLRRDDDLRMRARELLKDSQWLRHFWMHATNVLHMYFQDDVVAKQIALDRVSTTDASGHDSLILLPLLRGYPPAQETLRKFAGDSDVNVSSAARGALVDDPSVHEELLTELESENSVDRRAAAEILEDVDDVQDRLAARIGDSDKNVRRIAYGALRRLARPVPDVKRVLNEELESSNRLAAVESLLRQPDDESRMLLRSCVASDYASEVRERAASGLRRGESALPLRGVHGVREALSAAGEDGHSLKRFLTEPRKLSEKDDEALFRLVVAWTAAKLVATLPEPAPMPEARLFMDPWERLLGESESKDPASATWQLRLAMDASDLPRNRNVWPAANATMAWRVASHLLAKQPRSVVLACADLAYADLAYPPLEPGQVCIGPTFFGFRLHEA